MRREVAIRPPRSHPTTHAGERGVRDLELLVTAGLGDNSYVLWSNGEALVVDPQRDIARFLEVLAARGLTLRWVLETHVHNDYVSGALALALATGARVAGPVGAGYAFDHLPLAEGDELTVGALRLVAAHTPGHTPEHMSYLVLAESADAAAAAFTGGSLMIGGAGRTDLLGPSLTDELTRSQYRTLRRLSALPDEVEVFPTHGKGSFCGAALGPSERTGTLAEERLRNPALTAPDEESFVEQQLSGLLAYPTYYGFMAPLNRSGAAAGSSAMPPALGLEEVGDGLVIDARRRRTFAAGHIPGSVNVELGNTFSSYVGWLPDGDGSGSVVQFNEPLVLVLPEPEDASLREAVTQLARIGWDDVRGYLAGGIEPWRASGRPVGTYPVVDLDEFCRRYRSGDVGTIVDVRQRTEWDAGHIPGSQHLFVGDLPGRLDEIKDEQVWLICTSGQRASIAASLVARHHGPASVRLVAKGGVERFLSTCRQLNPSVARLPAK
ncbi:MAG TPA: MBL fold metallo-hydrolase [Actinobacteria bacterium]|nr:MBL fold metallo-hydrolase [Actinomycetota bacterium]